ncbi:MAG: DNA repair protein RadA [Eubacteriales bacterium]|nr:DNA repair protein RadA [Eubacteriales bacterium]
MGKAKIHYVCAVCGNESSKWMGRCPSCGEWNTLEEFREPEPEKTDKHAPLAPDTPAAESRPLDEVVVTKEYRFSSGMSELDRALGGGIVPGSLVLIGGDPGIGKSTLLLQLAAHVAESRRVLYASAEESASQIKTRADRLGVSAPELFLVNDTDLNALLASAEKLRPALMVIDSIQTVYAPEQSGSVGSVGQVRECTSRLMRYAKSNGITVFIVGHVTKEGALAGPKVLEHLVDTVLYFEGDNQHIYRVLRSVKNRFGSTNEIGVFTMTGTGMEEVVNPNEVLLEERDSLASGSAVTCSVEGTRPMLIELQALVAPTSFGNPRRTASGYDYNRMALLLAVLEKKVGIPLANQDVYVSVAGGIRLDEPCADLALALAVASAYRNEPLNAVVAMGEISLTGEIRSVSRMDMRVAECAKMGIRRVILPKRNLSRLPQFPDIELIGVSTVYEAIRASGLIK